MKTRIKDLQKGDQFLRLGTRYVVIKRHEDFMEYRKFDETKGTKYVGVNSMEMVLKVLDTSISFS